MHLNPPAAAAAPASNLPKLTPKQNIDLKMLQAGTQTIDKVKAKLRRGAGFPPKPMPDAEIKAYIKAVEAHLNGKAEPEAATKSNLPELNPKQKIDLKMLQGGHTTIDQIQAKLKRGTGFPPVPTPDAVIVKYIAALQAHLSGGAAPSDDDDWQPKTMQVEGRQANVAAPVSAPTPKPKPVNRFLELAKNELEALERLTNGTYAELRTQKDVNAAAAQEFLDIDRDVFLGSAPRQEKKKEDTNAAKPEYKFGFIDRREMGWNIQVRGLAKTRKEYKIADDDELIERILAGDPALVGVLADSRPGALARVTQFMERLKGEELEMAALDPMVAVLEQKPDEFHKHFSQLSSITSFINIVAKHHAKRPKEVIACLSDRFVIKETLEEVRAMLPNKQAYYKTGSAGKLVKLVEGAVVDQVGTWLRNLASEDFYNKTSRGVQQEYKYVERNVREKSSPAKLTKETWISDDVTTAIVPMLYMMNILIGSNQFQIAAKYKSKDRGKWSPHYLDTFVHYVKESRPTDSSVTYLAQILTECNTLKRFSSLELPTHGVGAQLSIVETTKQSIDKCDRMTAKVAPTITRDWTALRNESDTLMKQLEELEMKAMKSAGDVTMRLMGPPKDGQFDYEALKPKVRKYAVEEMMSSDDDKEKVYLPQSVFDEFTLRNTLHTFCNKIQAHQTKVQRNFFYAVSNPPPRESLGS